jgi:hypothetical protein
VSRFDQQLWDVDEHAGFHHRPVTGIYPVTESIALPPDARDCIMSKRKTIEQMWHEQSEATKEEAAKLPYGRLKEQMLRMARQLETASHINQWVSSPGLRPPTP